MQSRVRVLVIDDSEFMRSLVARVLGDDFIVEAAEDGAEALERLARSEVFDAILVDLAMPHIVGAHLHALVHEKWPRTAERMIFVAGSALSEPDERFLRTTTNPVLTKPFANDTLRETVRTTAAR